MKTIAQFIEDQGIEFGVVPVSENPNMDDMQPGSTHWRCIFNRDGRTFTCFFSMGPALTGPPEAGDVLDCLASDSAGYENAGSFEEWAAEYGYDEDSRKAYRTYQQVERQRGELGGFLGRQAFEELLWETERE